MDLMFNELSCKPLCNHFQAAEDRMKTFLLTCKRAKSENFNRVRFHQSMEQIFLTETETLESWLKTSKNHILKNLLISIYRQPYIKDEDEQIVNDYIRCDFQLEVGEKRITTEGFAAAHLYSTIGISFDSDKLWEQLAHTLIIKEDGVENQVVINQVSKPEHFETPLIQAIKTKRLIYELENEAGLLQIYPKYIFESNAITEILEWKMENIEIYHRLHDLLSDIAVNPFTGGKGKTEALLGGKGLNSKRLTKGHRIVYTLKNNVIKIISCKGHYGDK